MTAAIVVLGVLVLLIFIARLRRPADGLYLGATPIGPDDPLIVIAQNRAKETIETFLELAPAHMDDAMVKFRFPVTEGTEQVWAYLRAIEGDRLRVSVAHPLVDSSVRVPDEQEIALTDVTDWQIEMQDGTIRGGFTNHAMFGIHRRDGHDIPSEALPHEARFVDA